MQAALDLANADFRVYLVESKPSIGGVMAQLDKTFPTNDCAMCTEAPRLVEVARHPNIRLLAFSEVEKVEGQAGRYSITVRRKCSFVDPDKCTGCGICAQHCPAGAIDAYNEKLASRRAVYLSFPQAIPRVFTLDQSVCVGCGLCKNVCGPKAIDYQLADKTETIEVGAVILAPGFELFDANNAGEIGYGRYPNVVSSLEYERIMSASGPFRGHVMRPSDGKEPKRIAFVQCVGSRDTQNNHCSSVCCMYATKHSLMTREHIHDAECSVFYIDMRAFSKGFEAYYERAKQAGVQYIRCRPSSFKDVPGTGDIQVRYNLSGKTEEKVFDLVVLSCGLSPNARVRELAGKFDVKLDDRGFCEWDLFTPVQSSREGVFICGPFAEPKDIPETVMQASAAAGEAAALLSEKRGELVTTKEFPPERDVRGEEARIGVFVCHCGTNIGGVVDVKGVAEYAATLPNVVYAGNFLYSCSTDTQEIIKQLIKEHNLNRVIVSACTPRTHEPLFQNTLREGGLNPFLFEMANIRDQCSWVHMNEPQLATKKSRDLVRMAVAKARLIEPLSAGSKAIFRDALVIGGGVAGLTAALGLADQGFVTHLVEKSDRLGGKLRRIGHLLDGTPTAPRLAELEARVLRHGRIKLYLNAEVKEVKGALGSFVSTVKTADGQAHTVEHAAIIVATGAEEWTPDSFLYGQNPAVMTQLEAGEQIGSGRFDNKTVVMIQCVGSRDEKHPYCSRICCQSAVKHALELKKRNPETQIYVLYRELRAYGHRERYYKQAREAGVMFLRFPDDRYPTVAAGANGGLRIETRDDFLGMDVAIDADFVFLSAAVEAPAQNSGLGQMMKIALNEHKFFLEAHMKLRPIDFATDGVFLAGLAHYPKTVDETISQAMGAVARASTILSKEALPLSPIVSRILDVNCDGCAYCVDPCPYKAITLVEYMYQGAVKKTVQVDETVCKGCGTCMATCPKGGCVVSGFKTDQLQAMLQAALEPG
ncbi:MAG: CoB--CoM heterodisulfide reductase iron-sulfur subunit A family protein [Deltaproteobacteria bacterium]|nr:CoB--CoM heterodisulfide reductase iron-sulfur subunit A family protein [Deltaproteobacteria bacterium]